MFNLYIESSENLLSSVANPYVRDYLSHYSWETTITNRHGIEYISRSVSTGDDYPSWWLQLPKNVILSERVTHQDKPNIPIIAPPSPRQHNQSIQTESKQDFEIISEQLRPSTSLTTCNHYEIIDEIDDGNNARRLLPYHRVNNITQI